MDTPILNTDLSAKEKISNLLDGAINQIRAEKLMNETGTLEDKWSDIYHQMSRGNVDPIVKHMQESIMTHLVSNMMIDFLKTLAETHGRPNRIFYHTSYTSCRIWAVVDSEAEEEKLFKAEFAVNAKYHDKGAHIDVMTVESADNIPFPSDFKEISDIFSV